MGNASVQTTIQVLPPTIDAVAASGCGSFSVLRFAGSLGLGLVHLDGPAGGVRLTDSEAIHACTHAFDQVRVSAAGLPDQERRCFGHALCERTRT
jgi:Domain of unknown function (DUF5753)